jgi:hypothetical protein
LRAVDLVVELRIVLVDAMSVPDGRGRAVAASCVSDNVFADGSYA